MTRIYLTQALCGPRRHAILARAEEVNSPQEPDPPGLAKIKAVLEEVMRTTVDRAIAGRQINPWCGICEAPREGWLFEAQRTQWATLEEALPHLKETEAANLLSRAIIDAEKARARRN